MGARYVNLNCYLYSSDLPAEAPAWWRAHARWEHFKCGWAQVTLARSPGRDAQGRCMRLSARWPLVRLSHCPRDVSHCNSKYIVYHTPRLRLLASRRFISGAPRRRQGRGGDDGAIVFAFSVSATGTVVRCG